MTFPSAFRFSALLFALSVAQVAPSAAQSDWHVDSQAAACATATGVPGAPFCTIGEALSFSSAGDRILVAAGTYDEVLLLSHDLELVGLAGAQGTTVRNIDVLGGAVVKIQGFSVADSNRTGVTVIDSTLTMTSCVISGHVNNGDPFVWGGGFHSVDSNLTLVKTLVVGNEVRSGYYSSGGGIAAQGGSVSLLHSTLTQNSVHSWGNCGAGAGCGEIALGGGISVSGGSLESHNSMVTDNSATTATGISFAVGGGIAGNDPIFFPPASSMVISHSTIAGNVCGTGPHLVASYGGGILGSAQLEHSILAGNVAASSADASGTLSLEGYSLIGNTAGMTIFNHGPGSLFNVSPMFRHPGLGPGHGDFRLLAGSPCIDAGRAFSNRPLGLLQLQGQRLKAWDLFGNPRLLDGDLDRYVVMDIGAHEFNPATD